MVCSNDSKEVLGISNLILRGCTLRKTDWIVGAVVFAGIDTKIQCNQSSAPRKVTQLESHMNFLVIFVFFIQVCGLRGDHVSSALVFTAIQSVSCSRSPSLSVILT